MSGMTEPPYAYARASLIAPRRRCAKRAFSIGTITVVPRRIDHRFVREDGVGGGGARPSSSAPTRRARRELRVDGYNAA